MQSKTVYNSCSSQCSINLAITFFLKQITSENLLYYDTEKHPQLSYHKNCVKFIYKALMLLLYETRLYCKNILNNCQTTYFRNCIYMYI